MPDPRLSRIYLIADLIFSKVAAYQRGGKWPPKVRGILTHDDVAEYRAWIVTERLTGGISDEQATKALAAADQVEALMHMQRAIGGTYA